MPNLTSRLQLVQPLTSEAYDVGVPNGNMALIDAAPANVTVCTSATRPSTPDAGDLIYETDSLSLLTRVASAWQAATSKAFLCTSGTRPASGLTYGGFIIYETDTGNTYVRSSGNTTWIWTSGPAIPSATSLVWGGDTNIYRGGTDFLKTDDKFAAGQFAENSNAVTVESTQNTTGNTSSTSYTSTLSAGSACSLTFVAPTSGKVVVHNSAYFFNLSTNFCFISFDLRTGAVVGSGTQIVAPSDLISNVTSQVNSQTRSTLLSGLTPGATYNIRQFFKVDGNTGTFLNKQLVIVPIVF